MKATFARRAAASVAALGMAGAVAGEDAVTVCVDCGRIVDEPLVLGGYVNVSRRAPPPVELGARIEKEYGRPKVTRLWLMLDQMWDYRTGKYRFNYEINRDYYKGDPRKKRYGVPGVTTGLCYHDYIDSVSRHSDALLMNIRRYEQEVVTAMVAMAKWKEVFAAAVEHYKRRCPNLRYVEVLNEPTAKNQSNIKMAQYYGFYRAAYEAVGEVNDRLKPKQPVLVGGNAGFRTKQLGPLIRAYAADKSRRKRLDFLSFHDYWVADEPAQIAGWEGQIVAALKKASLPTDIPVFVTEIGCTLRWKGEAPKNLQQAAGMTACLYHARHARRLRLFPWVQYHSKQQIALVQFDTRMRMTPFGAAVKMLTMHKRREVAAESPGMDEKGKGLGVLATLDETGLAVELWNYQRKAAAAEVTVRNLPASLRSGRVRIRRYLIDAKHSNCFADPDAPGGLDKLADTRQAARETVTLTARLQPMALCLWLIEPAEQLR